MTPFLNFAALCAAVPLARLVLIAPLLLAAPLFAGCQPVDPPDAEVFESADPADVRSEIEAMSARYQAAARAGDAAAIQALHADDAVLHPPNEPAVRGRAAVDAHIAASHAGPTEGTTFTTLGVGASGELAYEVGAAVWPDGPGSYLTVYRRTADGWRIVADTWSDDAPSPTVTN